MSPSPLPITATTPDAFGISVDGNNHLTTSGFSYDSSGNVLNDGINAYAWNAESETKTAAGVNYIYDGLGNRVEKANGTLYWYGPGGEVLDETDLTGNLTSEYVFFAGKRVARRDASGNIYYYAEDFIGSSRVITQSNGTVCSDADFLPFGQEVDYTSGCAQNYKFEGKERDIETGNDNFGARYYRSALGRWMSPDWSAIPAPVPYANLTNPETLNLYAMTSDNPETFADLDGHDPIPQDAAPTPPAGPGSNLTTNDFDAALQALLASLPPPPIPPQPMQTPQNPTDVQQKIAERTQNQDQQDDKDKQGQNQNQSPQNQKPQFDAKPLSKLDKIIMTLGCLAGMDPDYAKPIENKPDSPKDSTDSTKSTEGQRTVYGPNKSGKPVLYNPKGGSSRIPDNVAGGAAQAASTSQCIANVWTAWPRQ